MRDSAPEYAVEALDRVLRTRGMAAGGRPMAGGGGPAALATEPEAAFALPSLSFKFRAPSFLGNRSRWVLFALLVAVAVLALVLAWDMVKTTSGTEGNEWVWPPIFTLIVAAFALGFAFATVMGFGEVELSTSIGESTAAPTAFTVSSTVPEADATGVAVDVQIEAAFSGAVDAASLSEATFVLRAHDSQALVAATVSLDADGTTGRLRPNAPLQASTAYDAEITTAVKSTSGTALAAATKWGFVTAA